MSIGFSVFTWFEDDETKDAALDVNTKRANPQATTTTEPGPKVSYNNNNNILISASRHINNRYVDQCENIYWEKQSLNQSIKSISEHKSTHKFWKNITQSINVNGKKGLFLHNIHNIYPQIFLYLKKSHRVVEFTASLAPLKIYELSSQS